MRGRQVFLSWILAALVLSCFTQTQAIGRIARKHLRANAQAKKLTSAQRLQLLFRVNLDDFQDDEAEATNSVYASVHRVDEFTYDLKKHDSPTHPKDAVAWGQFDPKATVQGWDSITIGTSKDFKDGDQAYAAGYLEGALTRERIWDFWTQNYQRKDLVYNFMRKQDAYLRQRAKSADPNSSDPEHEYNVHVGLTLRQLDGITQGYNDHSPTDEQLSVLDFWLMNNDGDILDIERAVGVDGVSLIEDMSRSELVSFISINGHCSALIKKTDNELWGAHTTWSDYSEMLRMFKHYQFAFNHHATVSQKNSFSSYPGFISSTDDFYLMDSNIVVIETTLNILNDELYKHVSSDSTVMAWVRTMVANRLAKTGKQWTELFSKYNSGTYNNQWMVIDYNKYQKGMATLEPETFFVLEQIPGFIKCEDKSSVLNDSGYWASYNRPFFQEINEKSMYKHYTAKHGEEFSYEHCPRAQIFKRDQGKVNSVDGLKALMQYNDYLHDPLSKGCPGNAIASRFDLAPAPGAMCDLYGIANGATDSKITNSEMSKQLTCLTRCGPTHDNADTPTFMWTAFINDNPDAGLIEEGDAMALKERPPGQPDLWGFDWMTMSPADLGSYADE